MEDTVDEILSHGAGVPYVIEDSVDIVGYEAVTGPLGEEASRDKDDEAVSVALGTPELRPAIALKFLLHLDGVADFLQLKLSDLIFGLKQRVSNAVQEVGRHGHNFLSPLA